MTIEELLGDRKIYKEAVRPDVVADAFGHAGRDLEMARAALRKSADWAFTIAYTAALRVARAYVFSKGYRPASKDSHKNTFEFLLASLPGRGKPIVEYFDRACRKRNAAMYDAGGFISKTEAEELIEKAAEFIKYIGEQIGFSDSANGEE